MKESEAMREIRFNMSTIGLSNEAAKRVVEARDMAINALENSKTIYDVDKVIKELELHSFELGTDTIPVHYVRLNDAIEIVKAGVKNE